MLPATGNLSVEKAASLSLVILLVLLCANVYVIHAGKSFNDRVCRDSILLAGQAALNGKSSNDVRVAARAGMDSCGTGGFFVNHPQFTEFKDDITPDVRVLKVQTRTVVRIPVPFLILDSRVRDQHYQVFTATYYYKIKNPKFAESEDS